MRTIEVRNNLGFAFEALLTYGIGRKMWWKNLDRYSALQPSIPCAVYLAHPARTDRLQDLIGPKSCSRENAMIDGDYTAENFVDAPPSAFSQRTVTPTIGRASQARHARLESVLALTCHN